VHEAVICAPIRTPVGAFGGQFAKVPVSELAAGLISHLVSTFGVPPDAIDDVILGQGYANGESPALGRVAALDAGLPVTVPGAQVDRRCGSGLQAVINAAMQVQTGASDLVIAGGAESMSQIEHYTSDVRWGTKSGSLVLHDRLVRARLLAGGQRYPVPGGMIETAENLRRKHGISRLAQDEFAVRSHQRAAAAQDEGRFTDEIVPVTVRDKRGNDSVFDRDEQVRPDANLDSLARLRPIMLADDSDATVTAGNASGQNDGAALCVVTTPEMAVSLGLRPYARLVSWAVSGTDPAMMGLGPVTATAAVLKRTGRKLSDVDLIELNEAFAAQVLAVLIELGIAEDDPRLNVNGSGISLGHPIGATGARILATMLHEQRRRGAGLVLETMCIGGGQGLAALFEGVE
jgi:acetyl-CoA C-acetyltransferase